ncbi:MAG: hypothetical protein JWO67_4534 [Streptosporangiaceae bacterium]|nr:hypothetical protein [Streptosporangiaceae bacterium]
MTREHEWFPPLADDKPLSICVRCLTRSDSPAADQPCDALLDELTEEEK